LSGIRPSILILYDYFYPGYKAGGPIQSLTNLAVALNETYSIYVITSCHDLRSTETYKDIAIDQWNEVNIPVSRNVTRVYYAGRLNKGIYEGLFNEIKPAIVYFNNIYSYPFFRLPLQTIKSLAGNYKIVICPRGMLQAGALAVKTFKKKIYLAYLHFCGLLDSAYWHATNEEEACDIKKQFPKNKGIVIAPNIPKPPVEEIFYPAKAVGQLRLVFLSLIAEKKNLLLLLQVMLTSKKDIVLDIYGPVTDEGYWQQCLELIQQMPGKVQYRGEVKPTEVQKVLAQYHALILLTKGENFGHALYESMSAGRPVITSYFTPWKDLQEKSAGANADILDMNDCLQKLDDCADMDQDEYNLYCKGAHRLALQYYQNIDAEERYGELFG
jgi:glycosyltransferase involved in cell wall biosynthesis